MKPIIFVLFSSVKSEDFADFKTLTLKISANVAASVLHT